MRVASVSMLLMVCSIVPHVCVAGGSSSPPRHALYADFDNKVAGSPIDLRGASFGEPVELDGLDADVVDIVPGQNRLRIGNDLSSPNARRMRWQLLGGSEIDSGEVRMSFDLTPSALDKYSFVVRERDSAASAFLNVNFSATGSITTSDANGTIAITQNAYAANTTVSFVLAFDMDSRTSTIAIDGAIIASERPFGVADRGVAELRVGYQSGSAGSAFDLDNIRISGPLPFAVGLEADFEDKAVGEPIGEGGAVVNEPVDVSVGLDAIVRQLAPGMRYLDMTSTDGSAVQSTRWQALENLEVRTGLYVLDFDSAMATRDRYRIALREPNGSTQVFMNLQFWPDGTMSLDDVTGSLPLNGITYDAGQVYRYRIVHDLDAGRYDIYRDGIPLIRERVVRVDSRGIGAVLFSIMSGTDPGSSFKIDALRVLLSKGELITADLEFLQETGVATANVPVTPAVEVGALNLLDQPVPDGTPVTLEIAEGTGPAGASLGGASATTTAGIASFPDLSFDMAGTYRLLARSFDAIRLSGVEIVVAQGDAIFADGFD